jgi:hypothetical protein
LSGAPTDSISVAVTGSVDPSNLTRSPSVAERFVFERAYEMLVGVDCSGNVVPGLAESWAAGPNGQWTFELRRDARFWNGDSVTPQDIISSWRASGFPLAISLANSAVVAGTRSMTVVLPDSDVRALASLRFAINRQRAGRPWPEGTGPYAVDQRGDLLLVPIDPARHAQLRVHTATVSAARDLVDAGIGLLVTDDQALASYAASRPDHRLAALEWDRTWALVMPVRGELIAVSLTDAGLARVAELRTSLARDAVRADARGAVPPAWGNETTPCPAGAAPPLRGPARVVYSSDDPAARGLAERLAALASIEAASAGATGNGALALLAPKFATAGARITASPLAPAAFVNALAVGNEFAYIVAMPYRASRACINASVVPLIDTRWHTIRYGGADPRRSP